MSVRRLALLTLAPLAIGLSLSIAAAGTATKAPTEQPAFVAPGVLPHRVIAYYFHTTYRCASCRSIEAYSKEAIDSAFVAAIKDGRVVWKVVNVEAKGNEHFVKDYGLYTKSLVLVDEVRGKRTRWKNLPKVWELLNDKPQFLKYVQDELGAYLTGSS